MKLAEAMAMTETNGYRVSFQRAEGGLLIGDSFPDRDEPPFQTENEAWAHANKFACERTRGKYVNIYVIHADNFRPVADYQSRYIKNR